MKFAMAKDSTGLAGPVAVLGALVLLVLSPLPRGSDYYFALIPLEILGIAILLALGMRRLFVHAEPGTGATDRFSAWLGPTLPDPCLVTVTLDIASGTQACGLLLRTADTAETGYELRLEPVRNRVVLDRWPRGRTGPAQWQARGDVPYAVELERPCPLPPGRHTVQVLLDGSVFVAVVDNRVALSTRLYDHPSGRVGLFTSDGEASLNELTVARRP